MSASAAHPLVGQSIVLQSAHPCVRILNATGAVGCATAAGGALAPLHILHDENAVAEFLSTPSPTGKVALAIGGKLLTDTTLDALRTHVALAGVAVLYDDAAPTDLHSPAPAAGSGEAHEWNSGGTGLTLERFPFAIVALGASETESVLRHVANDGVSSTAAPLVDFRYPMNGRDSAPQCLAAGTCLPVGGQSVWASLRPRTEGTDEVVSPSRPGVGLSAAIDASAFFHDQVPGGYAAIGSLVAVLAAVDAVVSSSELSAQLPHLPTTPLVFAFTAEAWGETGSRRFLTDVRNFTCEMAGASDTSSPDAGGRPSLAAPPACETPFKRDLRFLDLRRKDAFQGLIQIGPVGASQSGTDERTTLFVHVAKTEDFQGPMAAALRTSFPVNASVVIRDAKEGLGLPPGAARSFTDPHLSLTDKGSVAMLSDFDTEYLAGGRFGSRFDTIDLLDPTRVCDAANAGARAWWKVAGGHGTPVANCTMVTALLHCFTFTGSQSNASNYGMKCPLAQDLGLTVDGKESHYTGVFIASRSQTVVSKTAEFVRSFLSAKLASLCDSLVPSMDKACEPIVSLHDAFSPGIEIDEASGRWRTVNAAEPLFCESNWPAEMHTILYPHGAPSPNETVALFGFGIIMAVATIAVIRIARKTHAQAYQWTRIRKE